MKPISNHREHVFPGRIKLNNPMNSQTANAVMKHIGFEDTLTAHGLRLVASICLNEAGLGAGVIEAALAHKDSTQVRNAYNRSTYLGQRIVFMNWWGKYVDESRIKGV